MGDSPHTTHHTSLGMAHCPQKCVSKYLCKTKNSTSVGRPFKKVSIYIEKILPYAILRKMGYQNDPRIISKRTVRYFSFCTSQREVRPYLLDLVRLYIHTAVLDIRAPHMVLYHCEKVNFLSVDLVQF